MSEETGNHQICKNCSNTFTGNYCNNCGEKIYTHHDHTILNLVEEGGHFITHFDGSFLNTLKAIFKSPGSLSEDYCNGIRKKYFRPISFFLLIVVIYLLFPFFQGLNQQLYYHTHNELYGKLALKITDNVMNKTGFTAVQMEEHFHAKGEKVSKFLLLVIIPLCALFLWLFTYKKRPLFFDQLIFSTEINIFYLLWGYLLLPLFMVLAFHVIKYISGKAFYVPDEAIGITVYIVFAIYISKAAGRFYSLASYQAVIVTLLVVAAHFVILQYIYKFLLFIITIWQIHN